MSPACPETSTRLPAEPMPPPAAWAQAPAPQDVKRRRLSPQCSSASTCSTCSTLGGSSPLLSPQLSPQSPASLSLDSDGRHDGAEGPEWWSPDAPDIGDARRLALEELHRYLGEWASRPKDSFWHRKSGKPVLSVVVCRCRDGSLMTYRGMNTEVSLPAGSLCAERAAIARAASEFQQASGVVAVATADPLDRLNPLWPCEVCQSWLAKLRPQSPEISVIAVQSILCDAFAVKVNGELQPPPQPPPPPPSPSLGALAPFMELVELADGTAEWPWEAKELIYVDGAWTFLHPAQQRILKEARARGSHLLVGVHADETLKQEFNGPILESFSVRMGRVLQNRHVSSVLRDAPWAISAELIQTLGIQRVITGTVGKIQDVGMNNVGGCGDPYDAARELGILEVVPSLDETTERSVHESHVAMARC
mmetsp:Transcript_56877/g.161428  ORF Transcript_56877/g.161428 Transcript_56877/m.161428 type:complete len:422 (+) Transcript_56877:44-1309(+)